MRLEKNSRYPKSRLDRLATYLETKAQQLCHYLEGLEAYIRKCRSRSLQTYLWISVVGLLSASLSGLSGVALGLAAPGSPGFYALTIGGFLLGGALSFLWQKNLSEPRYKEQLKQNLSFLTRFAARTAKTPGALLRQSSLKINHSLVKRILHLRNLKKTGNGFSLGPSKL